MGCRTGRVAAASGVACTWAACFTRDQGAGRRLHDTRQSSRWQPPASHARIPLAQRGGGSGPIRLGGDP
eukprot:11845970-Heterocapsa_arctica.AAC.1